jgi:hypothetical protein
VSNPVRIAYLGMFLAFASMQPARLATPMPETFVDEHTPPVFDYLSH